MASKYGGYKYVCEFAPSGRAKCGGKCKELIPNGSLRFGANGEMMGQERTFWRHWACVTDRQVGNCETARNIFGLESLGPVALRTVLSRFGELHLLPEFGDHDPPSEAAEGAPVGGAKAKKEKKARKSRKKRGADEVEIEQEQEQVQYTPAAPGLSFEIPSISDAALRHLIAAQPLASVVVCITGNFAGGVAGRNRIEDWVVSAGGGIRDAHRVIKPTGLLVIGRDDTQACLDKYNLAVEKAIPVLTPENLVAYFESMPTGPPQGADGMPAPTYHPPPKRVKGQSKAAAAAEEGEEEGSDEDAPYRPSDDDDRRGPKKAAKKAAKPRAKAATKPKAKSPKKPPTMQEEQEQEEAEEQGDAEAKQPEQEDQEEAVEDKEEEEVPRPKAQPKKRAPAARPAPPVAAAPPVAPKVVDSKKRTRASQKAAEAEAEAGAGAAGHPAADAENVGNTGKAKGKRARATA